MPIKLNIWIHRFLSLYQKGRFNLNIIKHIFIENKPECSYISKIFEEVWVLSTGWTFVKHFDALKLK